MVTPLRTIKCLIGEDTTLQVHRQRIKPSLLRPSFRPFSGHIYVEANLPNGVGTKGVAIAPKALHVTYQQMEQHQASDVFYAANTVQMRKGFYRVSR
ncbi:unnamed protein product [Heligmosomoides polygyrus]|uniref:Transposase n=1 Tax=Heligmosomoides polygyrus TaxID=6339 RepID=A0A183F284_HELPZ|nr:unnamed protein product [Heligmosomoides polygyrus]